MECVFCQIAKGMLESHKVYEDEMSLAFLDIRPINPGHILVIPKEHVSSINELEEKVYLRFMNTVRKMSGIVEKVIKPKKVGLAVAGFDIEHLHIHVVPMFEYHDLTSQKYLSGNVLTATETDLASIAVKLKNHLAD